MWARSNSNSKLVGLGRHDHSLLPPMLNYRGDTKSQRSRYSPQLVVRELTEGYIQIHVSGNKRDIVAHNLR